MSKKAQGLPFNMIVLIIIALFILLIIIAWATGIFGSVFQQTKVISEATEADVTAAQTRCTQYCISAQGARNFEAWNSSAYCTTAFTGKDWNGDGTEDVLYCDDLPIGVTCSTDVEEGPVTEDNCR